MSTTISFTKVHDTHSNADLFVNSGGEIFLKGKYEGYGSTARISDLDTEFVKHVYHLQTKYTTDVYRFYGFREGRKHGIRLMFEFMYFRDEHHKVQAILKNLAAEVGANVQNMSDYPHCDKFMPRGATQWQYGANHGRLERQVEFFFDVTDLTTRQVGNLIKRTNAAMKDIWPKYGVSVI